MSDSGDVYVIPFRGDLIECMTGLDAVAVKLAAGILSGGENASPIELQQLASIFDRYGRHDDAQRLLPAETPRQERGLRQSKESARPQLRLSLEIRRSAIVRSFREIACAGEELSPLA